MPTTQTGLWMYEFLSTLSSRRATCGACGSGANRGISIHALLAESDSKMLQKTGSFVVKLAILPLPYEIFRDLSKSFQRFIHFKMHFFGAKTPGF